MDLNYSTQNDVPFSLGIQTAWQLEMMAKFGHNSALSIDATFGTNQTRVRHILCLNFQHMLIVQCQVMSFHLQILSSNYFHFLRCPTCLWQYPLYTVMVFDDWMNDIFKVFFAISYTRE